MNRPDTRRRPAPPPPIRWLLGLALAAALVIPAGCGSGTERDPVVEPPEPSTSAPVATEAVDPGAATEATEAMAGASEPTDEAAGRADEAGAASAADGAIDPALPPTGELDGLPVGFTEGGHPYRGAADAPIVVEEYSDYHCPFCARFTTQTQPLLLEEYGARGDVRFVFREFPIAALHPNAVQVHLAARCVAEQGAEAYWRLHDALFERQADSTSTGDLEGFLAAQVAALELDTEAYAECSAAGRPASEVQAGIDAAAALGFNGTPSFLIRVVETGASHPFVGAQPVEDFRQWFDALLAGEPPPVEPTAEPPELPFWADEGLAPDPERPGLNLAGDPYEGSAEAALTVVEFTDYQCPPCRELTLETHPAVRAARVDSGQIRWVVKNLPLPEHEQASVAAAAAECAAAEGRFWEMHEALFEQVERWSIASPDEALIAIAGEIGLDETGFAACLAGREAMQRVLDDQFAALAVTQSTPTLVILDGETGSVLRGNRGAEELLKVLDGLLEP